MKEMTDTKEPKAAGLFYEPRKFNALLGMPGFSDKLLSDHFKLYEGYVSNVNAMLKRLEELRGAPEQPPLAFSEIKRRFGWEFDGMRLHELYFENLGGRGEADQDAPLFRQIDEQFGSRDAWKNDFLATGAMRGIGWVALTQDDRTGLLFNGWVEEHNGNHLAGCRPLLIMDVYEHAFMTDYGLDKKKYMQAFFSNIRWDAVFSRFAETREPASR
jgi:Fe-Mn family superoxide dismutase